MATRRETAILLVEDDDGHADLVKWNLERTGLNYSLYHARNGQQALDLLLQHNDKQQKPKLGRDNIVVLLDINMPVMDGYEVLERLREQTHTRHLPVIMLTTAESPDDVTRCYELGCNLFLRKPVGHKQLATLVQQLGALLSSVRVSH